MQEFSFKQKERMCANLVKGSHDHRVVGHPPLSHQHSCYLQMGLLMVLMMIIFTRANRVILTVTSRGAVKMR